MNQLLLWRARRHRLRPLRQHQRDRNYGSSTDGIPGANHGNTSCWRKTAGNVGSLKSAPSSHYTLQLSSSSNYDNLNGWAKKENLKTTLSMKRRVMVSRGMSWFLACMLRKKRRKSGIYIASRCPGQKPVGETAASGTGRSEVIIVISRNGLSLRSCLKRWMLSELSPQPEKV